ncbi:MAG: hypothetical protein JWP94_3272 [Mucilaginibacter sp.]|jgi:hypothetical protein|nr:hypothetical protein [Mucilaginibacter sp.]
MKTIFYFKEKIDKCCLTFYRSVDGLITFLLKSLVLSIINEKLILSSSFLLLFNLQLGHAQNNLNSIAITPIQGVKTFSTYNNPLKGSFYGAELAYQLNMGSNNADWVRLLHVKDIGLIATYFNLGDISIAGKQGIRGSFGNNYGITSCLNLSLFETDKISLIFSPGIGIGYSTQTFYTTDNPIVGSHINLAIRAGLKLETPISSSTRIQAGVNFSHYSNASTQLPNDGLNNVYASLGVVRDIDHSGPTTQKTTFGIDNKHSFEFSLGVGRRGFVKTGLFKNPETGVNMYLTDSAAQKKTASNLYQAALYAGYSYRLNQLLSLKIGTDAVYYSKTFSWDNFFRTYQGSGTSYDHLSVGLSAGTDIWLGRLAFTANYGYYLHYNSLYPIHFYSAIGGKYYITNRLALSTVYRSHSSGPHYVSSGVLFTLPE